MTMRFWGRRHYELGVRLRRPRLGRAKRAGASGAAGLLLLAYLAFAGPLPLFHRAGHTASDQVSHRLHKIHPYRSWQTYSYGSARQQIKVSPVPLSSGAAESSIAVTSVSAGSIVSPAAAAPAAPSTALAPVASTAIQPTVATGTSLAVVPPAPETAPPAAGISPAPAAPLPSSPAPAASPTAAAAPLTAPVPASVAPAVSVALSAPVLPTIIVPQLASVDLTDPVKKDIAMRLVSSAENSSLDWKAQYAYIEDIGDGRGYTGGIIGFCSGTGDMLEVVQNYAALERDNPLAKYIPALQQVNGTASHTGLGTAFVADWKTAAADSLFQKAQDDERDKVYFNPAVQQAKDDGLRALGQFIYYDAIVMHGPGNDATSFGGIRAAALKKAKTPAQTGNSGDETAYLNAFLDARAAAMKTEAAHDDTSRVDTEQRVFLQAGNLDLNPPLNWKVYGDSYSITQ